MEIKYTIDDSKLANFTSEAISKLVENAEKHTLDVVNESEKVEESLREYGANSEITGTIVFQAVRKIKNHPTKRMRWLTVILKVLSEILLFFAGCLFDRDVFAEDSMQFYLFCGVSLIAMVLTIALHFKEGE